MGFIFGGIACHTCAQRCQTSKIRKKVRWAQSSASRNNLDQISWHGTPRVSLSWCRKFQVIWSPLPSTTRKPQNRSLSRPSGQYGCQDGCEHGCEIWVSIWVSIWMSKMGVKYGCQNGCHDTMACVLTLCQDTMSRHHGICPDTLCRACVLTLCQDTMSGMCPDTMSRHQDGCEIWVSRWVSKWVSRWVSKWVSRWVSRWVSKWVSKWVSRHHGCVMTPWHVS